MFLIQGKCKLINRLIKSYKSKQSKKKKNETPRNGILYVITKCLVIINCEDTKRVIAAPSPSVSRSKERSQELKNKDFSLLISEKPWNPWEWGVWSVSGWDQNRNVRQRTGCTMVWKKDIIILWSPKYEGHWWSSIWHMTGVWKLRYVTLSYVMICDILYVIFYD